MTDSPYVEALEKNTEALEEAARAHAEALENDRYQLAAQRAALEQNAAEHRGNIANAPRLEAESFAARASDLFDTGMYEEAIAQTSLALARDAGCVMAHYYSGLSHGKLGDSRRCNSALLKGVKLLSIRENRANEELARIVVDGAITHALSPEMLKAIADAANRAAYQPTAICGILFRNGLYEEALAIHLASFEKWNQISDGAFALELSARTGGKPVGSYVDGIFDKYGVHQRQHVLPRVWGLGTEKLPWLSSGARQEWKKAALAWIRRVQPKIDSEIRSAAENAGQAEATALGERKLAEFEKGMVEKTLLGIGAFFGAWCIFVVVVLASKAITEFTADYIAVFLFGGLGWVGIIGGVIWWRRAPKAQIKKIQEALPGIAAEASARLFAGLQAKEKEWIESFSV